MEHRSQLQEPGEWMCGIACGPADADDGGGGESGPAALAEQVQGGEVVQVVVGAKPKAALERDLANHVV
ncbi:hypothetical protein [Streptomyces sp. NPDC093970]|uniref:hypothetical protein n=1 Tax=Streptomyces sp. NPDC093970 TaxID=3155076 RepID=UPI0034481463